MKDKIMNDLFTNNMFSHKQFRFLKDRSTVTQLLVILEQWIEGLESGGRFVVVCTDLAFDEIPHRRLF